MGSHTATVEATIMDEGPRDTVQVNDILAAVGELKQIGRLGFLATRQASSRLRHTSKTY